MATRAKQVPDPMHQRAGLARAGTGIDQQWASIPGCRRFLAVVEDHVVARTAPARPALAAAAAGRGWSDSSPDSAEVPIVGDLGRTTTAINVLRPKPIGRTQKLSRENVGLDFLTLTWGVAFDLARAAVNRVAA